MTQTDPNVERYLDRVRTALRGMPGPEIEEILLELRGHIAERSAPDGDVDGTLRSLGDPRDLARQYRTDRVAAKAECSGSPLVILHSLMLLRRGTFAGWAVFALAAFGYAWALAIGAAAIEKIFSPRDVGLWWRPGSWTFLRLTVDGPGPSGTREILGWWIVPAGLIACAILLFATREFARWWIRRSRGSAESLSQ